MNTLKSNSFRNVFAYLFNLEKNVAYLRSQLSISKPVHRIGYLAIALKSERMCAH